MTIVIASFSPVSCVPVRSGYCLQDPVFKLLSSLLFSEFKRPNYTAVQNCRPTCGFNILIFYCFRYRLEERTRVLNGSMLSL